MDTDWQSLFDEAYPEPGADETAVATLSHAVRRPLSAEEVAALQVTQRNPYPADDPRHEAYRPFDPARWTLPAGELPPSYLDFLLWSDGGDFRKGERWFRFHPVRELRPLHLGYYVPQYMPGALLFGSDGGNVFYFFDMRQPPVSGEYPILIAANGNLGYGAAKVIAPTFLELCRGEGEAERLL